MLEASPDVLLSLLPAFRNLPLPWVQIAPGAPYFQTEDGKPWHPIGQNDAVTWFELGPLFRRKDVDAVDGHLRWLAAHGVTCLRMMLEYAQRRHRYFETAPGAWSRSMVQYWDDLFCLCEKHGLRLLLTPYDTFWMWLQFKHHPYSRHKGGPLRHPSEVLLSREVREVIKRRLTFAAERWGGSGALFGWDLWNEIHPAQAKGSAEPFAAFIAELSAHVREVETRKFGRTHPQTVSLFGPELRWKPHMKAQMEETVFRHPALDFATIHIYEHGTIDDPKNTVDAAVGMGRIVRESLAEIRDGRPFLDTEHGPIHRFKDYRVTLPETFDDEYFRHMQWAHLASGGAGGGMRWPNRHPHALTHGMRAAQRAMAGFLPLVDWSRFNRRNVSEELELVGAKGRLLEAKRVARFGCASRDQAVVYLLRRDARVRGGVLNRGLAPLALSVSVPGLEAGRYAVSAWDTVTGVLVSEGEHELGEGGFAVPALTGDLAVAIRRVNAVGAPGSQVRDTCPGQSGMQWE